MTPAQRKALQILWAHGPIRSEEFIKHMWPFSPSWLGLALGAPNFALEGAAGTFLGRLLKMGLVAKEQQWANGHRWFLTELGRRVLRREQILEKIA